jgi:hypothetical protein
MQKMKSRIQEQAVNLKTKGKRGKRVLFVSLSTALGMGAFVPLVVNLALAGRFTWSLVPLGATGMSWLILAPLFILSRHRALASWLAAAITLPLFLWLVESLVPAKEWLLPLGLPSAAFGLATLFVILWVWRYSRLRIWYALSGTGLACTLVCVPLFLVVRPYLPQPDPALQARILVFIIMCGVTVGLVLTACLIHGFKFTKSKTGPR